MCSESFTYAIHVYACVCADLCVCAGLCSCADLCVCRFMSVCRCMFVCMFRQHPSFLTSVETHRPPPPDFLMTLNCWSLPIDICLRLWNVTLIAVAIAIFPPALEIATNVDLFHLNVSPPKPYIRLSSQSVPPFFLHHPAVLVTVRPSTFSYVR